MTTPAPEHYAEEIRQREALLDACPIDVYTMSISKRWAWRWKLMSYYEARPGAADSADMVIIDSGYSRIGRMDKIIAAARKTDADIIIPPDLAPGCAGYDDRDPLTHPEAHAEEVAEAYWEFERSGLDAEIYLPVHPPVRYYVDALRHWDPGCILGYRDDPAFDYPRTEEDMQWYLAGHSNHTLTLDLVEKADGIAVGGLKDLTVADRIDALREIRAIVGSGTPIHALAPGTEIEMLRELRENTGLVTSLDVSTPERAPANNKLPDKTWTQHRHQFPTGRNSSTVRAAYSGAVAAQLAYMLTPQDCTDDLLAAPSGEEQATDGMAEGPTPAGGDESTSEVTADDD